MKVISGCQTGADQGALYAAKKLDIETGGFCTKGNQTEDGPRPDLIEYFHLTEMKTQDYPVRTEANVKAADGTVVIGRYTERGTALTLRLCDKHKKPCLRIGYPTETLDWDTAVEALTAFIQVHHIQTLNVAGNRESINKGIQRYTRTVVGQALFNLRG